MAKKADMFTRKRRKIPRETWRFQLRLDNAIDSHVRDILKYAESQRRAVTMIRDGVRLFWALENDDLNVLFELFPNLRGRFMPESDQIIEQFRQILREHQI